MANPSLQVVNGPGERDLELAFLGRNLGAKAKFTVQTHVPGQTTIEVRILNFTYVTCHGPQYQLGCDAPDLPMDERWKFPPFNFLYLTYNAKDRFGGIEFSNGE